MATRLGSRPLPISNEIELTFAAAIVLDGVTWMGHELRLLGQYKSTTNLKADRISKTRVWTRLHHATSINRATIKIDILSVELWLLPLLKNPSRVGAIE
jgi:hypothetical protein